MVDETTDPPHMEEAKMSANLNKLANTVTSEESDLTNLTMSNIKLEEQLKVKLAQNKVIA